MHTTLTALAIIRSPYHSRFGIPRQPGLAPSVPAEIVFERNQHNELMLRGLECFSHYWIIFGFHELPNPNYKPLVQPPRLGGKTKVGVLASRSPFRPNNLGLSLVKLVKQTASATELIVHISGGDFLDNTPVWDLKPYIPYSDAAPTAQASWATAAPLATYGVSWSPAAQAALAEIAHPTMQLEIEEILACDPRPAHERQKNGAKGQTWGFHFRGYDVRWEVVEEIIMVRSLERIK